MAEQSMDDLTGWQRVTCEVADLLRYSDRTLPYPLKPFSSLTDPDGQFGAPLIYTEWGIEHPNGDMPLLREYRWSDGLSPSCAHYVPEYHHAQSAEPEPVECPDCGGFETVPVPGSRPKRTEQCGRCHGEGVVEADG